MSTMTTLVASSAIALFTLQNAQAVTLQLVQTVPLPSQVHTVGRWSGGALLIVRNEHSAAPVFEAYDRQGAKVQTFTLQIPNAVLVSILSGQFARNYDGSLAIAGVAYDSQNHGTNFLALISPGGGQQTIIRTDQYFALVVTIAPDGTTWTAGSEGSSGAATVIPGIIRRYAADGKLLGVALAPSQFGSKGRDAAAQSRFAVSKDRVDWYSPAEHVIVEFSLDGSELGHYSETVGTVKGIAVCADNSVWIASGQNIHALNRSQGTFQSVQQFGQGVYLYGCESDTLISGVGAGALSWLQPH